MCLSEPQAGSSLADITTLATPDGDDALGARYRLQRKDLPGKPDLVMPGRKLAFFVHGCFWHGHDCARGARVPKANRDYWLAKVARNKARDAASTQALTAAGWRVETIWECEMKDAEALKARLAQTIDQAATRTPPTST